MLYYPKIAGPRDAPLFRCIAFEKYDGTNLHWVWDRDFGWHAFGTRRDEYSLTDEGIAAFGAKHAHLHESVGAFEDTLAEKLDRIFRENSVYRTIPSLTAFTEFYGPNSFAGLHKADEPKELRLFDIFAEPFGFIGPSSSWRISVPYPSQKSSTRGASPASSPRTFGPENTASQKELFAKAERVERIYGCVK